MPELSKFEQLCNEVESGPFSILSDKAKDEIKRYIRVALADGYDRGLAEGKAQPESAKKHRINRRTFKIW
jgi:hypothetical protein